MLGNQCMENWVKEQNKDSFLHWFANFNGDMVVNFSELLALVPYLLRSMRLGRIFRARDLYCRTGKLPQRMIEKWAEIRVMKCFLAGLVLYYLLLVALAAVNSSNHLASYNLIERAMMNRGLLKLDPMIHDYSEGLGFMIAYNFVESIMLMYALKVQWFIDSEYNIFTETLLVSVTWITLSNVNLICWLYLYRTQTHYATLNSLRWVDFAVICSRSFICIIISTVKNIKDSTKQQELILIPPDERSIESLEMLHNIDCAIIYFYEYLEQTIIEMEQSLNDTDLYQNNLKLLGLYMDIRCYDTELIKQKET